MKIKKVCELTGLTDRTIRYYIEEHLISPVYAENYLGRKSFDFSQEDVNLLKSISVLRKFDFTIEEIREIINDVEKSKAIIQNVKIRNSQALAAEKLRQSVLSQIMDNKAYTVAELAGELAAASENLPNSKEKIKNSFIKSLLTVLKTAFIFLIVWLPIASQILFVAVTFMLYAYPKFYPSAKVYMLLSVLPSVFVVLLGKIKANWKKIPRVVLLVLCSFSLLCSIVVGHLPAGMMAMSETTDFAQYRDVDADCLANRDLFFSELFPAWPHYFVNEQQPDGNYETVYLDAHYYYRYISLFDYTYDIYAEWPLEKGAFDKEVERVTHLFNELVSAGDDQNEFDKIVTIQKGNYTCLVYSAGYTSDPPFEEVTDSYTYYIFAYDEENLRVRYIYCDSLENGADQPYYLSLDW